MNKLHSSRRFLLYGILSALLTLGLAADNQSFAQQTTPADIEQLEAQGIKEAAALASPSVVRIQTVGGLDRVGQVLAGTGATTGVVVSSNGYIISSMFNFAADPTSVVVTLLDGKQYPAKVVANDHLHMLTLLKVEASNLIPATAFDKSQIRVGQWAIALGRTYDSPSPNVSVGIVSALDRVWGKAIQTDAKISPANYGGPLVAIDGSVMGVLVPLAQQGEGETAGVEWYDSGIGFAIPMTDVIALAKRLTEGKDLHPGLLGVTIKQANPYSGKPVIDRVRFNSPSEKAGLKSGDVISAIDGRKTERTTDVKYALGNKLAGDTVKVVVLRDDKPIEAEVTLIDKLEPYQAAFFGVLPTREPVEDAETGVGVRHVFAGSPAEKAGLQKRDQIVKFDGQDLTDAANLADLVSRKMPGETAEVGYRRGKDEQAVTVTLAEIPNEIPAELLPVAIPAKKAADDSAEDALEANVEANKDDEKSELKTGRFTTTLPGQEQSFWVYVPDEYNPSYEYGLMVWLHPSGDTMEAALYKSWKSICDRRGIIIVAPKAKNIAGWTPNEAEFVKDAAEWCRENYTIDGSRIFSHGFSDGGAFAYGIAFKYRELFRGVATFATPLRIRPPDNEPDKRLQFHLVCGKNDTLLKGVEQTVNALQKLKFPATFTRVDGIAHKYGEGEPLEGIGRWADLLDRI